MLLPKLPSLEFIKQNTQFAYSILLIVLIPAALAFNTWWNLRAFDRDINLELRREADLVASVFGVLLSEKFEDRDFLVQKASEVRQISPEISGLAVLKPSEGDFELVFTDREVFTKNDQTTPLNNLAWSQSRSFAALIFDPETGEKLWSVVAPIKDLEGKKTALSNVKISTQTLEAVVARTTRDSLIILGATILLILLLLGNHLRFLEYSVLYEKLREADQLKDDFVSAASHDLKIPVAAIKGYVSLMMESPKVTGDPELKEYGDVLTEVSNNLDTLANEILEVTRIEGGRIKFAPKDLDLRPIVSGLVDQFKLEAQGKGLALNYTPPDALPLVSADEVRAREVLTNFISNAIKYSFQGSITIGHEVGRGLVKTWVRDNGVGIPAEEMPRLFTKFGRIRTEANQDVPGTGLGLWITKQLVEKMGGNVYAESIEGEGSKFTVVFPAVGRAVS